jgi:transposase
MRSDPEIVVSDHLASRFQFRPNRSVRFGRRFRQGDCGQVFTAPEPEEVGPEKYDETAVAMIAQLKYGSGAPFYRLEQLEGQLGILLAAATQWEVVEEAAEFIKPARDELIRRAAQGEVIHNDDTSMRLFRLARERSDERTGVFTSGIVSTGQGWKIALYFTGPQHAGENIADVLKQRAKHASPPIQMCDALSRNVPKLPTGVEILLANCGPHGRRQFVEVAANFPDECRYVLEMLGKVYGHDAGARERGLRPKERLQFHQERSGPVMEQLQRWLEAQFAERKTIGDTVENEIGRPVLGRSPRRMCHPSFRCRKYRCRYFDPSFP